MLFEFSPEVCLLLLHDCDEKVPMLYNSNPYTWPMPLIGPRPPYYTNPRYVVNYPLI